MLDFDAGEIVRSVSRLRRLESWATNLKETDKFKKKNPITRTTARIALGYLGEFSEAIKGLKPRATQLSVAEFRKHLVPTKLIITYKNIPDWIQDIAITFRRELTLMKTFCVSEAKQGYFDIDLETFGKKFSAAFPSAIYEIDEAGKCYALGRSTACVFHLMRAMEIGIRTAARALGIPDPVKGSERNWGAMLKKIKDEIDRRNGTKPPSWQPKDRELFEEAYVSLDAVRVAWRNTTMHVENKYTEDEAEHIFVTVRGFMKKLASRMDEQGQPAA
jgi:hypothetical protein